MNWIDWLFVFFLAASIVSGFQEGFIRMGIGFAAMILGFFSAAWFTGLVAEPLLAYVHSKAIANLIAFQLIFFGVMIAGALLGALLSRLLKIVGLSWVDRILGGGFGIVRGFAVVVVVAMVVTAFAPSILPKAMDNSTFAPYVMRTSRTLTALTPYELRHAFDQAYDEIRGLWEEAIHRKPKGKKIEIRNE